MRGNGQLQNCSLVVAGYFVLNKEKNWILFVNKEAAACIWRSLMKWHQRNSNNDYKIVWKLSFHNILVILPKYRMGNIWDSLFRPKQWISRSPDLLRRVSWAKFIQTINLAMIKMLRPGASRAQLRRDGLIRNKFRKILGKNRPYSSYARLMVLLLCRDVLDGVG